MRRLVAILLLSLLPLQWTYAAVADYCQHEATVAAQQHPGHHAHEHADPPSGDDTQKGALDWDCPSCHHAGGAVFAAVAAEVASPDAPALVAPDSRAIAQREPDNPFRPPLPAGL